MKFGFVIFLICMGLGIYISNRSYYQVGYGNVSRNPAAIKRVFDFSNLEGSALSVAAKQRLLEGVEVIKERPQEVGVELGHFVLKNKDGQKVFACEQYDKVSLTFEAEGMAFSGDKPKMELEGACEVSADINRISPLTIPVDKILGQAPGEGEFQFFEGKSVTLRFENVFDEWPRHWSLKSLRLYNSQGGELNVTTDELSHLSPTPVILQW